MSENIYNELAHKSILITGATGLIGSSLVKNLLDRNLPVHIIGVARSREKAEAALGEYLKRAELEMIFCDDIVNLSLEGRQIDYIIHAANPTASKFFVNNPVETMLTSVEGTSRLLAFAREAKAEGMVFLSTMEVYGTPTKGSKIDESNIGLFDPLNARNSYPLGKLACENLCFGYASEYGVPVKVARLTQTFGPGVEYNDGRVFAEFARCAIEKRDIVLKTKGLTERCYLYTDDAVEAIITILLRGEAGQAYTVANEETYCSIYEMASMVADKHGIRVEIQEDDIAKYGYANVLYMDLDTSKLKALGWKPQTDLESMFDNLIEYMSNNK